MAKPHINQHGIDTAQIQLGDKVTLAWEDGPDSTGIVYGIPSIGFSVVSLSTNEKPGSVDVVDANQIKSVTWGQRGTPSKHTAWPNKRV